LDRSQAFLQEDQAQQNAQQRVDVISQAGFHNIAIVDAPYINQPVNAEEQAGNQIDAEHAPGQGRTEFRPLLLAIGERKVSTNLSTLATDLGSEYKKEDKSFKVLDSRNLSTERGGILFDMLSFDNKMKLEELPV